LYTCTQCRQLFRDAVYVALMRAACLRFAGRAETDEWRQQALINLGGALSNVGRYDEGLVLDEELLATMRRLYGPDVFQTIQAEESLAITLRKLGGDENLQRALQTLTRVHSWKTRALGRDDEETIISAAYLSEAHRDAGNHSEAERLIREMCATRQRVNGGEHYRTLEAKYGLVCVLQDLNKLEEARAIRDAVLPVARRVLGPTHRVTLGLTGLVL